MADVSLRLRTARERAGLRLEDISARTKIKLTQLQAIERGDFDRLPGDFFTRAFLRNYAREVGLSPEQITREYEAERREEAESAAPFRAEETESAVSRSDDPWRLLLSWAASVRDAARQLQLPSISRSTGPVVVLGLVLLIVISFLSREPERPRETGAVAGTGGAESRSQPAATTGQPEPSVDVLSVEVRPTAEIWISAKTDGKSAVYRLVQPGERLQLHARSEMTFRIGNAAAFEYSINGVPGRAVGAPGEVREFQITRENFRTYYR